MNIFQVLSQGKSRLHEPSMSAMLGYLLDSNKDHGLGDRFVRQFLSMLDDQRFKRILEAGFIDCQVSLEEPYELKGARKDIDIQLILLDSSKKECHRLIIENKIKSGSARVSQLSEYYEAVINEETDLDNLTFVFLTPDSKAPALLQEFEHLKLLNHEHAKYWIHWNSPEACIVSLIREILILESSGTINPINEYIRHTLKAFAVHCISTTSTDRQEAVRNGEDIGELVDEARIETLSGKYRVLKRDSSQIQVFNVDTGEKEVARRILVEFIEENGLEIPYGSMFNTRTIGKKFFEWKNSGDFDSKI